MKFAFGKAVILGLAVTAASFTGCSSDHSRSNSSTSKENAGELGLQLQVGDLTVNSVHYVLTNGTNSYSGDKDVGEASTLSFVIGSVIAGTGYTLTLTATATDGTSQCAGNASGITVTANQTVPVSIELRCTKVRNKGSVLVDGTVNECPDITSIVGDAPSNCSVGLHVSVSDDGKPNPPGALTYTWTGATGLVGANPTLNCQVSGQVVLSVNVSDGDVDPTCSQTFGVTVICPPGCPTTPPTCTDGIQNQGETDIDCGGTANTCPKCATGKKCVVAADCSAAGATCTGGICVVVAPPTCTDGIKNGTETGIDCGGVSSGVTCPACASPTDAILAGKSAACLACAKTNCLGVVPGVDRCETVAGNAPPSPNPGAGQTRQALCLADLQCQITQSCWSNNPTDCFCGTNAPGPACLSATNQNGLCRPAIEAGIESTSASTVLLSYVDPSLGGGMANAIVGCLSDSNCPCQ